MDKKIKPSKSLGKLSKKVSERFVNDLYFNPKRRKELRELFAKSQKSFEKELEKPLGPSSSIQSVKNNYWAGQFMDSMTGLVDVIDKTVPQKLKEWELTNCNFILFKKRNGNSLALQCDYYKGVPKKHYKTCLLIPAGLPKKGKRTKAQMLRGLYELKSYEQIDKGTFTQKFIKFTKVEQVFKGEIKTIKFVLTQRGKVKDDNWLQIR
jgi:hypothetical protein